jgi:hypothetical protein
MTGNDPYERSFHRTAERLAQAYTRPEIEDALDALSAHLARYPHDRNREIAHGLARVVEALEQREEESRALGLSPLEHAERERLLKAAAALSGDPNGPEWLARRRDARACLDAWLERHPQDPSARRRAEELDSDEELAQLLAASLPEPSVAAP